MCYLIYLLFNLLKVISNRKFINIAIFHQFQDCIVNMDVMHQIQHFLYQIKGEIPRIPMMQLMLQKIKMIQSQMQIKRSICYEYGISIEICTKIIFVGH